MHYRLVVFSLASSMVCLGLFRGSSHTPTTIEPNLDTKAEANQMLRRGWVLDLAERPAKPKPSPHESVATEPQGSTPVTIFV